MYLNNHWDIARTKEDIIAYLTQIQPDIIVIGEIEGMSVKDIADYIRTMYRATRTKTPENVFALYRDDVDIIFDTFNKKTTDHKKQVYRQQLQKNSIIKTPN